VEEVGVWWFVDGEGVGEIGGGGDEAFYRGKDIPFSLHVVNILIFDIIHAQTLSTSFLFQRYYLLLTYHLQPQSTPFSIGLCYFAHGDLYSGQFHVWHGVHRQAIFKSGAQNTASRFFALSLVEVEVEARSAVFSHGGGV
jgi:hypothetical protein